MNWREKTLIVTTIQCPDAILPYRSQREGERVSEGGPRVVQSCLISVRWYGYGAVDVLSTRLPSKLNPPCVGARVVLRGDGGSGRLARERQDAQARDGARWSEMAARERERERECV